MTSCILPRVAPPFSKAPAAAALCGDRDKQGPDRGSRRGTVAEGYRRRSPSVDLAWPIRGEPARSPVAASGKPTLSSRAFTARSPSTGWIPACVQAAGSALTPMTAAQTFERAHKSLRVRTFEGDIDSEFSRKPVKLGQGVRRRGRHDRLDLHGLSRK